MKPLLIAPKRLPKGRSQFPENPYEYCFIISIIVSELRLSTLTSTSSGNVASRLAYIPYVTKLFDEAFKRYIRLIDRSFSSVLYVTFKGVYQRNIRLLRY